MLQRTKAVAVNVYDNISKNHIFAFAGSLSYFFVLSLFPALIAMAAIFGYLPIPDLWSKTLDLLSRYVPHDGMGLVRKVLADVVTPNKGKLLSFGLLGTLWAASSGFAATIEALNVAYDVPETRPYWKTRSLAFGLTFGVGTFMVLAVLIMIVGPEFGSWLAIHLHVTWLFARAWPALRWITSVSLIVAAVEGLYFWAPNVKQRFYCSLPGAMFSVLGWIGLSYLLGIYFQRFANFNKTYGTLGAAIALMVWFYWSGFVILVGAELNAEILSIFAKRNLPIKEPGTEAMGPPEKQDVAA